MLVVPSRKTETSFSNPGKNANPYIAPAMLNHLTSLTESSSGHKPVEKTWLACLPRISETEKGNAYHWLDIRVRHGFEYLVVELQLRTKVDIGTLVLRGVTVLGSRKDGDTASIVLNLVAVHADLVRTDDGLEPVVLAEPLGDIRAKLESHASLAGTTARGRLRVGPQHLHHKSLLPRLSLAVAVEFPDILQGCLVVREESSVQNQVLVADQSGQRQGRERLGKDLEHSFVVLGLAFAFEPIDLVHVVRLVVPAVEEDPSGTQPLVGIEEQRNLGGPRATVDKVAVEEICVLVRGVSIPAEDLQKVEELAMRITTDGQLSALVHPDFNHCRLRIDKVLHCLYNLEDIFAMYLLAVLEPLEHIVNELLRHLGAQPHAIVLVVHGHRIDIQLLERGGRVTNLDGLFESLPSHKLLAVRQFQFRIAVIGFFLHDSLEVLQGLPVVQDSSVGQGTSPVCLSK